MEIPNNIKDIMQKLLDSGYEAYIIGGAIRDYMLGEKPNDYDIFTNATGEQILGVFPKGKILGGEERQRKILTVIVDGVEVSQYRSNGDRTKTGNNLFSHLKTCDLWINVGYCGIDGRISPYNDVSTFNIRSPYNDINAFNYFFKHNINSKYIKFVGDASLRINEDYLRILRAIKFALKYNFEIDKQEQSSVKLNAHKIKELPVERIKTEFMKLLDYENCFDMLKQYGLLKHIIPRIEESYALDGGKYHNETVFEHNNQAFKNACKITTNRLLRLTTFLHDYGKIFTLTNTKGYNQFINHDYRGAKKIEEWMELMKFSKKETKYVKYLVKHHMLYYLKIKKITKLIPRFVEIEDYASIEDLMLINWADCEANFKKRIGIGFIDFLHESNLWNRYKSYKNKVPFRINEMSKEVKSSIVKEFQGQGPKIHEMLEQKLKRTWRKNIKW